MPIRELEDISEIKVKTVYNGGIMITYINPNLTYEQLRQEMRGICRFPSDQIFTMKWVDEEGDPCIISTQNELETAIRLFEINKEPEITIHEGLWLVFTVRRKLNRDKYNTTMKVRFPSRATSSCDYGNNVITAKTTPGCCAKGCA
ncbi:hypothetical protein PGB90_008227 [Kerria lacca]